MLSSPSPSQYYDHDLVDRNVADESIGAVGSDTAGFGQLFYLFRVSISFSAKDVTYLTALLGSQNELLHGTAFANGPGHKRDTVCSLNFCLFLSDCKFWMKWTLESPAPNTVPDTL